MDFFKKRIRILARLTVLCLLSLVFPASIYAQETEIGSGQSGKTILTTMVTGYVDDVENGKGEAELSDGTIVTVEGATLPDGLLLVVENIETEDWVAACMEGLGSNLRVYDIYFVDSKGQRYEVTQDVRISISLNGLYKSPVIYSVSQGNAASKLESSVKNDQISFAATHNSYYVLAEKKTDSGNPGNTGNNGNSGGGGTAGNTPGGGYADAGNGSKSSTAVKTGDETNLMLWLTLCGGSAAVMAILFCTAMAGKKQRRGRKQ